MALQCPHCQNVLEVNGAPRDLVCSSCGSNIQLDPGETAVWLPENSPRHIGKFQLIERIGVGSFGEVFKAIDTELDRTVAIKIPRGTNVQMQQDTERFFREARSAAQLRHPGIVSLYDAGQSEGVYFLVSEYIQGSTLAERLSAKRYAIRDAAEFIAEVAAALNYAHERGVVHRDIKPSNIMIDLEGRPHIMDFGLAKRVAEEITLTLDGQVLGTPAYMSPEQAKGDVRSVDSRSDIYSLGTILYELVTGELPFSGHMRMLLVQVIQDEPRPPRRLNDQIPRDLETICLKAMAKQPAWRYPTASALVEDLQRFLRGEPIRARPTGRTERLWRWARRRPAVAALSGLSCIALLGMFFGSLYYNARLNSALQNETEHQARAENNFKKARDAVDRMLTQVGENKELEGIPMWQAHREKLLNDAMEFYRGFIVENDEPAVRREAGRAYHRVGHISILLGKRQQAEESLKHAIAIQQQLVDDFPVETEDNHNLALSYSMLGELYRTGSRFVEAEKQDENALNIQERLAISFPNRVEFRYESAKSYGHLGYTWMTLGRNTEAKVAIDKSIEIFDQLVRENNSEINFQFSFAYFVGTKALLKREEGNFIDSIILNTKAIQTLEGALDREPNSFEGKYFLLQNLMHRAETLVRLGRESEARKDWERIVKVGESQIHPDLCVQRAMSLARLGKHAAAVAEIDAMEAKGIEPDQGLYNFACTYSLAIVAAERDLNLTESERSKLAQEYGKRAVEMLRKARDRGFFTPFTINYLENDSDLSALRSLEDFRLLLQELKSDSNAGTK